MPTAWSEQLRNLAQRVAESLPREVAEEMVLTGSVPRGVADELSDIEMLVDPPELPSAERGPTRLVYSPPPIPPAEGVECPT